MRGRSGRDGQQGEGPSQTSDGPFYRSRFHSTAIVSLPSQSRKQLAGDAYVISVLACSQMQQSAHMCCSRIIYHIVQDLSRRPLTLYSWQSCIAMQQNDYGERQRVEHCYSGCDINRETQLAVAGLARSTVLAASTMIRTLGMRHRFSLSLSSPSFTSPPQELNTHCLRARKDDAMTVTYLAYSRADLIPHEAANTTLNVVISDPV